MSKRESDFIHLHVHSEYSLLDGACKISSLVDMCRQMNMPAVAITDHGNMFGAISFYSTAIGSGIKPIIGAEMYIAPKSRFDRDSSDVPAYHIVLLCRDEKGYRNLIKLTTKAVFEGFYHYPRIDKELLAEYSEGLIGLSACLKGEISYLLLSGRYSEAEDSLQKYIDIFGKENFYIELQENGLPEQRKVNKMLIKLAEKYGLDVVATCDVHYLLPDHAKAHDILLCIQTQTTVDDPKRMRMRSNMFYLASEEEMRRRFSEIPAAVLNTRKVAERCNVILEFGKNHMPVFPPPDGLSSRDYLWKLCLEGLNKRFGASPKKEEAKKRLEFEFQIIEKMGYINYFLIVWDFVRYAKQKNIPVGPGRGSAAGSMVSYLLGITDIDPLRYGLLFERFLNPERVSMPDIDIDFCYERRQEVIDYVVEKYGRNSVAQIITFGTMQSRAVVRDVARAMGLPYSLADKIAKMIPPSVSLKDALAMEPELNKIYSERREIKELIDVAMVLEGLVRHVSIHAAGVVIADKDLVEYVPLYKSKDQVCTAYEMKSLEKIGLLKMDFLGLKTLTVIEKTKQMIKQRQGIDLDIDSIPLNDGPTYELLCSGKTKGVFQLESAGMRDLLVRMQPDKFEDIIALLALYRPGPIGSGMLDDFIQRKKGETEISYLHPSLEPILRDTYGVILYQEQVMQIASALAGFSLAQADLLRRAMGKKIPEVMEEQREIFIQGCLENGVDKDVAERIFDLIEYFSGYGFNKSHSTAYALVSYRTAYLKANYPLEFMAALLTSEYGNTDKLVEYLKDATSMGIKVLPPDINRSCYEFVVEEDAIRFGLGGIKNVGFAAIEDLVKERENNGPYKDLDDFCIRLSGRKINRKVIESLVKAGAMDCFRIPRKELLGQIDSALERAASLYKDMVSGQMSLFGEGLEKRVDTANKKGRKFEVESESYLDHELLLYEREMLGFYFSGHPLTKYGKLFSALNVLEIQNLKDGKVIPNPMVMGVISKLSYKLTKDKTEKMAFITLEDLSGELEVICFPSVFRKYQDLLVENKVVVASGKVDFNDNGVKFILECVWPVEDLSCIITRVLIDISGIGKQDLMLLKERLMLFKGQVPVVLKVEEVGDYAFIELSDRYFVLPNVELIDEVEDIVGKGKVQFVLGE